METPILIIIDVRFGMKAMYVILKIIFNTNYMPFVPNNKKMNQKKSM